MTTIEPDVNQLKALTHPLRLRLLGRLRVRGSATASQLAEDLGESSGATSYHLRQLERHGFVEDDPHAVGNGRERWWRPTAEITSVPPRAHRDSSARDVDAAFGQAVATTYAHTLQQAARAATNLDEQWFATSTLNDIVVSVTPEQAATLHQRINDVLGEIMAEYPGPAEGDESTRVYMVQMHGFPLPEPRSHG